MKIEPNPQVTAPTGGPYVTPITQAVQALKTVDRQMAVVLRAVADAKPEGSMPADRLISLAASATGWDVAFLSSAAVTLSAMPLTWQAFDDGRISWSQIRGIILAARRLTIAKRADLDVRLSGQIDRNGDGEPDALVELAQQIATALTDRETTDAEIETVKRAFLRLQPDLFGGVDIIGYTDDLTGATINAALDAAADPPAVDEPVLDDDGQPIPKAWQAPTGRQCQMVEALRRVCAAYLDQAADRGTTRAPLHAKAAMAIVVDMATLFGTTGGRARLADSADDLTGQTAPHGADVVPSTLLWTLAAGRRYPSTARVHQTACDATRIPVLTDGDTIVAVGDATDPIPTAVRRAAAVRDQGCRFPGCTVPAAYVDLHHVVWRRHGGPTILTNLVSICRFHHTLAHDHGWQLTLHPNGQLDVQRGRYRYSSYPRHRPAPPTRGHPPDWQPPDPQGDPAHRHGSPPTNGSDLDAGAASATHRVDPLPF